MREITIKKHSFLIFLLIFSISSSAQNTTAQATYSLQWTATLNEYPHTMIVDNEDSLFVNYWDGKDSYHIYEYSTDGDILTRTPVEVSFYKEYQLDNYGNIYIIDASGQNYSIEKYSSDGLLLDSAEIARIVDDQLVVGVGISEIGNIFLGFANLTMELHEPYLTKFCIARYSFEGAQLWNYTQFSELSYGLFLPEVFIKESNAVNVYIGLLSSVVKIDSLSGYIAWGHIFDGDIAALETVDEGVFIVESNNYVAYSPLHATLYSGANEIVWSKTWSNDYGFSYVFEADYRGNYICLNREVSGIKDFQLVKYVEYLMIDKRGYIALNYTINHIDPEEDYPNTLCYTTSQNSFYEVGYDLDESEHLITRYFN